MTTLIPSSLTIIHLRCDFFFSVLDGVAFSRGDSWKAGLWSTYRQALCNYIGFLSISLICLLVKKFEPPNIIPLPVLQLLNVVLSCGVSCKSLQGHIHHRQLSPEAFFWSGQSLYYSPEEL